MANGTSATAQRFLVVDRTYVPGYRHGSMTLADALPPSDGMWPTAVAASAPCTLAPSHPPACAAPRLRRGKRTLAPALRRSRNHRHRRRRRHVCLSRRMRVVRRRRLPDAAVFPFELHRGARAARGRRRTGGEYRRGRDLQRQDVRSAADRDALSACIGCRRRLPGCRMSTCCIPRAACGGSRSRPAA